eukprot:767662-Hanusia_phi.AAC.11
MAAGCAEERKPQAQEGPNCFTSYVSDGPSGSRRRRHRLHEVDCYLGPPAHSLKFCLPTIVFPLKLSSSPPGHFLLRTTPSGSEVRRRVQKGRKGARSAKACKAST